MGAPSEPGVTDQAMTNEEAFAEAQQQAGPAQDGRWAVLHAGRLQGVFDTFVQASWYAAEFFPQGAAVIRQLSVPARRTG